MVLYDCGGIKMVEKKKKRSVFTEDIIFKNIGFNLKNIFPQKKGILLFFKDGSEKIIYGREYLMMMREIGFWDIDNWQKFFLNFAYNGTIISLVNYDITTIYLPKNITNQQRDSFINYIDNTIDIENKKKLNFYLMKCMEENDMESRKIQRDEFGRIKEVKGCIINEETPLNYEELNNYFYDKKKTRTKTIN